LLQTLLLGQPEFKQLLATDSSLEQLRQRVIAAHHLEAMSPVEVEPYVKHRLKCVGWSGNPAFDTDVFAELHKATGGIPRRLNQLMSRLMLLGAVEQKSRIDTAKLAAVRKEMDVDSAAADPKAKAESALDAAPAEPSQPILDRADQIAELQQTVGEVAGAAGDHDAAAEWINRLEMLELRVAEQDRAVRHVLTMLIEWFEGESQREAA
jgi:hypothetical protein